MLKTEMKYKKHFCLNSRYGNGIFLAACVLAIMLSSLAYPWSDIAVGSNEDLRFKSKGASDVKPKVTLEDIAKIFPNTYITKSWSQKPRETWHQYFQDIYRKYNLTELPETDSSLKCDSEFKPTLSENMDIIANYTFEIDQRYLRELSLDENGIRELAKPALNPREVPVLLTAASSNHYLESQAMIKTYHEKLLPLHKNLKLIYYDIGLERRQREELIRYCKCEVRIFDFNKYPEHLSKLKAYAWKPIIIQKTLQEYDLVMWLDASIRFVGKPLDTLSLRTRERGIQGMTTLYSICIMTSKQMFDFLHEAPCLYNYRMYRATWVTLGRNAFTLKYIIKPWVSCALAYNCMVDVGKGDFSHDVKSLKCHTSHTYDQAMLGILVTRLFQNQRNIAEYLDEKIFEVKKGHQFNYFLTLASSRH